MSGHTPGPWTAHLHTGKMDGEAHINGAHGCTIAYVGFGTESDRGYVTGEDAKANAHLIAAAPDLLEAILNSDNAHWTPAMRASMDKAIGKGSGE